MYYNIYNCHHNQRLIHHRSENCISISSSRSIVLNLFLSILICSPWPYPLSHRDCWSITDVVLHISLFFTVLWSQGTPAMPTHWYCLPTFLCLPHLLPLPVPSKVVFARPDDQKMSYFASSIASGWLTTHSQQGEHSQYLLSSWTELLSKTDVLSPCLINYLHMVSFMPLVGVILEYRCQKCV